MESKIYASVIVVGTALIHCDQMKDLRAIPMVMLFLLPPFIIIWFAEELGAYIGPVRGGYVN